MGYENVGFLLLTKSQGTADNVVVLANTKLKEILNFKEVSENTIMSIQAHRLPTCYAKSLQPCLTL